MPDISMNRNARGAQAMGTSKGRVDSVARIPPLSWPVHTIHSAPNLTHHIILGSFKHFCKINVFDYIYRALPPSPPCKFRIFSSPSPPEKPHTNQHSLPSPSHKLYPTTNLSVSIDLSRKIYLYVVFCNWLLSPSVMFSRLSHVTECIM